MGTDKKTIKSYDSYGKRWAQKARGGESAAHEYLEKPAMHSKLPDLKSRDILCLGCGTGEECNLFKLRGARRVLGIDISKGLIDVARESYTGVEFEVMDMEDLKLPDDSFDFIYSSLAIHYLKDWTAVLDNVYRVLRPGGVFLFSTHHPVKWGAEVVKGKTRNSFMLGYEFNKVTGEAEVYGDYLNARKIKETWFKDLDVVYYHRPMEDIMRDIRRSGFEIADFLEPRPVPEVRQVKQRMWDIHTKIPLFMIFELKKK